MQGKADEALAYEKRAVAVDPNCLQCLAEAAGILYAKGLVPEALETATLALGLAPEGAHVQSVVQLVEKCRRTLAEHKAVAAAPAVTAPESSATRSSQGPATRGSSPTR
jgi:hypothetical protein